MSKDKTKRNTAYFHLPGLFEFYDNCIVFFCPYSMSTENTFMTGVRLALSTEHHRIAIWGGGRVEDETCDPSDALALMQKYGISARLTFSNSLLRKEHLSDRKMHALHARCLQRAAVNAERRHRPFGPAAGIPERDLPDIYTSSLRPPKC